MRAKVSNTNKIQKFQSISLRKIINAPSFVSNYVLHKDLKMKTVTEGATYPYKRFLNRFQIQHNQLTKNLFIQTVLGNPRHRLKRNWCRDLLLN